MGLLTAYRRGTHLLPEESAGAPRSAGRTRARSHGVSSAGSPSWSSPRQPSVLEAMHSFLILFCFCGARGVVLLLLSVSQDRAGAVLLGDPWKPDR